MLDRWGPQVSEWRPVRVTGIEEQSAGDELVLYDVSAGQLHHLNPTASAVWKLCDGTVTLNDIVAEISVQFRLSEADEPASDVKALLQEWTRAGLINN